MIANILTRFENLNYKNTRKTAIVVSVMRKFCFYSVSIFTVIVRTTNDGTLAFVSGRIKDLPPLSNILTHGEKIDSRKIIIKV